MATIDRGVASSRSFSHSVIFFRDICRQFTFLFSAQSCKIEFPLKLGRAARGGALLHATRSAVLRAAQSSAELRAARESAENCAARVV